MHTTTWGTCCGTRRTRPATEAAYREAIRLDPKFAWAHCNLGWTLQQEGDLDGAVAEYKEALRIDPKQSNALSNLPKAERMRQVSSRLPDVLAGKAEPETPTEACAFAELCGQPFQKRYAAAARLFRRCFHGRPEAGRRPHGWLSLRCRLLRRPGRRRRGDDPPTAAARTALRQKALGSLRRWPSGRSRPPSAARPPS